MHDFFITEWSEMVFIPLEVLNKMAAWLTSQQAENGSFPEISDHIYARYFQPITVDYNGTSHVWHVSTTAYVVIALSKAVRLTSDAKSRAVRGAISGAEYLSSKLRSITDSFQMALVAYALDKAGHVSKDEAFSLLQSMARRGRYVYWSPEEVPDLEIKIIDNKQFIPPHADYLTLGAAGIATSYALLLHLARGQFEISRPIAHWLVEYPTSGYLDKLLEAEALNAFSKRETNHQFYNMKITLSAPSASHWTKVIYINSTNFPNYHEIVVEASRLER
ncbi:hypothetical protein LSH36_37g00032 [Paralvinella palmiformis]|uniref:Alpha-macroglobulin-like TED domain-containing protein n=1 Tax=Paralvinella palmiformis TaxID=53620 RepID=A0AAD9K8E9_9ANNE|nr:hypothetical protein LSH36_37g00032 [Paralvinella palmiformis]